MAKGLVHIWKMRQTVSQEHKGRSAEVLVACLGLDKAWKLALQCGGIHRALAFIYMYPCTDADRPGGF
jgi:hypothetical protein